MKTYLKIGAGVLAASFALAGEGTETEKYAYCYDDSGQTILSGPLGVDSSDIGRGKFADRGKFIAYYKGMSLVGYQENKISIQDNNARVHSLCTHIAAGWTIYLPPAPRYSR